MSRHKTNLPPINSTLIKTATQPNSLYSVLFLGYSFISCHLFYLFFYDFRRATHSVTNPNSWHSYPFGPCTPPVPSSELREPFRPDGINKCLTDLGGGPFPDSSGKIKDKWRIIDSQLSAKGISMTELSGSLPLCLSRFLPHLSPRLVCCSVCHGSAGAARNHTAH